MTDSEEAAQARYDALRQQARIDGVPCSKCKQLVKYDDFHFLDCPVEIEERKRVGNR